MPSFSVSLFLAVLLVLVVLVVVRVDSAVPDVSLVCSSPSLPPPPENIIMGLLLKGRFWTTDRAELEVVVTVGLAIFSAEAKASIADDDESE